MCVWCAIDISNDSLDVGYIIPMKRVASKKVQMFARERKFFVSPANILQCRRESSWLRLVEFLIDSNRVNVQLQKSVRTVNEVEEKIERKRIFYTNTGARTYWTSYKPMNQHARELTFYLHAFQVCIVYNIQVQRLRNLWLNQLKRVYYFFLFLLNLIINNKV